MDFRYPEQTFNGLLDGCKETADPVQAPSSAAGRKISQSEKTTKHKAHAVQ